MNFIQFRNSALKILLYKSHSRNYVHRSCSKNFKNCFRKFQKTGNLKMTLKKGKVSFSKLWDTPRNCGVHEGEVYRQSQRPKSRDLEE